MNKRLNRERERENKTQTNLNPPKLNLTKPKNKKTTPTVENVLKKSKTQKNISTINPKMTIINSALINAAQNTMENIVLNAEINF